MAISIATHLLRTCTLTSARARGSSSGSGDKIFRGKHLPQTAKHTMQPFPRSAKTTPGSSPGSELNLLMKISHETFILELQLVLSTSPMKEPCIAPLIAPSCLPCRAHDTGLPPCVSGGSSLPVCPNRPRVSSTKRSAA